MGKVNCLVIALPSLYIYSTIPVMEYDTKSWMGVLVYISYTQEETANTLTTNEAELRNIST